MVRRVMGPLLSISLALAAGRACPAQSLPPTPVPVTAPPAPCPAPAATLAPPQPAGGPPACAPYEDCNGPLLRGDPLLDRPEYGRPGWFGSLQATIGKPHVENGLTNSVTVAGITDQVRLPMAPQDWTGSPRMELGYRLYQGAGEVLFSYRTLSTDGISEVPNFDVLGPADLHSRLDVNVFDLDYGSREFSLGPAWEMRWLAGVRIAGVVFESDATGLAVGQRTRNSFWGAGPHLGLEVWRRLGQSEVAAICRIEGATLLGEIHQTFDEVFFDQAGVPVLGGATVVHQTQIVPTVTTQLGLGWTPAWSCHGLRFSGGYQFEKWWYVGEIGASRGELTMHGLFLRADFNF